MRQRTLLIAGPGAGLQEGTLRNGRWQVMAVPAAALAKAAAAALSDEQTRKRLGWIMAAILSPLILTLAFFCSLLSGSVDHNNSAVLLCFHGGEIPASTPAEYVAFFLAFHLDEVIELNEL